jgi:hypothetical protein
MCREEWKKYLSITTNMVLSFLLLYIYTYLSVRKRSNINIYIYNEQNVYIYSDMNGRQDRIFNGYKCVLSTFIGRNKVKDRTGMNNIITKE